MKKMDLTPEEFSALLKRQDMPINDEDWDIFNLMTFHSKPELKDWGYKIPLFKNDTVIFDLCFIQKNGQCSKHYHTSLFNRFIILYGKLEICIENSHVLLDTEKNRELTVSPNNRHYFLAHTNVILLEIYSLSSVVCNEDIIRLEEGGIID